MNTSNTRTYYSTFNGKTRKWEEADITALNIGDTVIEFIYSQSMQQWVTIPGTCEYKMTRRGLELVKE